MIDRLYPVRPDVTLDVWITVLEARLRDDLRSAAPGHCLRVADLPRPVLEAVAARFGTDAPPGVETYFVDRAPGPEPWRVGVHKVVERRNAEESAVLALFPPDLQLAAGDSVDISTFRAVPVEDLRAQVDRTLLDRIAEPLRSRTLTVLEYLRRRGVAVSPGDRLTYLAIVAEQEAGDPAIAGAALFALGLIPDFALFERPEEFSHRLGVRNLPLVNRLRDEGATPLERLLRLPLADEAFRDRLLAFFTGRRLDEVAEWGRVVATDPAAREFALDRWPLGDGGPPPGTVRIDLEPLKLPRRKEDGLLILQASEKLSLGWRTTPAPIDVPGLAFFRVQLLSADRVPVWESPLIKVGSGKTARRSHTVKGLAGLDSGIHFFRVVALDTVGDPFPGEQPLRDETTGAGGKRTNESDDFLLEDADTPPEEIPDVEPVTSSGVTGYSHAELLARWDAVQERKEPTAVRPQAIEWTTPLDARAEGATATIRFDLQHQYTMRLSQRLRRLELAILADPDAGGHLRVELGRQPSPAEMMPLSLPPDLLATRREVFAAIRRGSDPLAADAVGEDNRPVVALVDLCASAPAIERYAAAYRAWLESNESVALRLDVVLASLPDYGACALVSPTHPLRLLWLLQEQQTARAWVAESWARGERRRDLIDVWRQTFSPQELPPILTLSAEEGYLDAGPLAGGWAAYLPPWLADQRAVLAVLRARLGTGVAHQSEADIPPRLLADKLELFLRQHPYTSALILNAINPGDAALIVDALVDLEGRRDADAPSVRYLVRLFTDAAHREGVGDAFRSLADPERAISEAADRLIGPGLSFLFPKLTWSRHSLSDFLARPEDFSAHVTLLLDVFPVTLRVARIDPNDRSSFVYGLVQEAPRRFAGRGQAFTWIRRPAPAPCPDLSDAPGRSALLASLLVATGALQARVLAPNADTLGAFAVTALDLKPSEQSLLYSAHAVSTWVLTLDPHLGLDYFDAARPADRPGYLLDFTPEFVAAGSRQLLLTTRIGEEVARLMQPAATQVGLDDDGPGPQLLLEALRSLSGRLALRLLSSPSQVQGALGMALSRLFLEAHSLLHEAIVIPLDAHPELAAHPDDPSAPRLRGDLLVVSADPTARQLDFLLVEAKCHRGTGVGAELRGGIAAQLRSSEEALRAAFDPARQDPDRIDRAVQSWRLAGVLGFYLDRAVRYRLVTEEVAEGLRRFFTDLDAGYTLSVRKIGLVFRLDDQGVSQDTVDPELPIWLVGGDEARHIVHDAARRFVSHAEHDGDRELAGADGASASTADEQTRERIRTSFGRVKRARAIKEAREPWFVPTDVLPAPPAALPTAAPNTTSTEIVLDESEQTESPTFDIGAAHVVSGQDNSTAAEPRATTAEATAQSPMPQVLAAPDDSRVLQLGSDEPPPDESRLPTAPMPEYAVLLGDTSSTPQFGLLSTVMAEPWRRVAFDLNGCNTISVFGVQGSGKSYTVGAIIEMAIQAFPGLNMLPQPLGAVVFHYHQTQDYPPEFVAMNRPNDEPAQVTALRDWGVAADALRDVVVLTTADTIEMRREEFPDVRVEPIAFSSAELTVADWRFLMGATGNDALYLKLLNEVMRQHRAALTLPAIREGLGGAPLSDMQRVLAETRLDFAARFIDDNRSLRSLLRPGRLVVVDLRDEFIEREQALGLFVTMLNVFAGAGLGDDPFNKLIVFDEAHKYMRGPLIGQVVGVIREMRHKGVSVVVASQDPVNVPPEIIELSSAVVLHRFNSPKWLNHIQRSLAPLSDLTAGMLASLAPGEAFVWANRATEQTFTRRAVKMRMRPRITKHGGSTRRAVEG